jgi:hypothetical protein
MPGPSSRFSDEGEQGTPGISCNALQIIADRSTREARQAEQASRRPPAQLLGIACAVRRSSAGLGRGNDRDAMLRLRQGRFLECGRRSCSDRQSDGRIAGGGERLGRRAVDRRVGGGWRAHAAQSAVRPGASRAGGALPQGVLAQPIRVHLHVVGHRAGRQCRVRAPHVHRSGLARGQPIADRGSRQRTPCLPSPGGWLVEARARYLEQRPTSGAQLLIVLLAVAPR